MKMKHDPVYFNVQTVTLGKNNYLIKCSGGQ